MPRILKGALLVTLLVLSGIPPAAAARATAGTTAFPAVALGDAELAAVTAGVCGSRCPTTEPDEPHVIGYEWVTTRRVDGPAEQLNYSIHTEFSNVYGTKPITYTATVNDQCRYVWLSGGVGISTGFSVTIGRTYRCDQVSTLSGTIAPGYRVKLYRGEMRQVSTVTVAEYEVWSDGTTEKTGRTDVGRYEHRWYRFTPVTAKGY